jgi:hypothetical protein
VEIAEIVCTNPHCPYEADDTTSELWQHAEKLIHDHTSLAQIGILWEEI